MKLYRLAGLAALLAGTAFVQQPNGFSIAQLQAPARADDPETVHKFSLEIAKLKPEVSTDTLDQDSRQYLRALPAVRKALAEKSCAGHACAAVVLNTALFDTYLNTLQQKDYGIIGIGDVGQMVAKTSDIYVWSTPDKADFKLVLGTATTWADQTPHDRFVPKSDYILHIEKSGYEPYDAPCSNRSDTGIACGAALKKK